MDLKKVFEKQGGMKLIKQYWKSGVLLTAINQFLFLGRSRTALEILRLATTLKIKEKMYRKYKYKLDEFERDYVFALPSRPGFKHWYKKSSESKKYEGISGVLQNTVASSHIPSWLISAKSNNKILMATKELCYEYWKRSDSMWDYFLLHDFFSIVLEKYDNDWKKIIPRDNATPHILLLRLFDQYDEVVWNAIKEQTPFHKLTYKFSEEDAQIEGTNYRKLLEYND